MTQRKVQDTPIPSLWCIRAAIAFLLLSTAPVEASITRTITDPVGNTETWTYQENLGVHKLLSKTSNVDGKGVVNQYDANNNRISHTDAEGRVTTYTYNAQNQRTSMTEAFGTADARTTFYEYYSDDIDLVTRTLEPSVAGIGYDRETLTTYDQRLNPVSVTINGYQPDGTTISRTTSYAYNAIGQVVSIDGPRTDVSDITTFTYNDCTTGGGCGQLARVTNAAGHIYTYDTYDAGGLLLQSTDANGTITTYTYAARQRIKTITVTPVSGSARTTRYTYDNIGQVTQVSLPDGRVISNTYNAARYLTSVTDNQGNKIEYAYDLKGNRIKTQARDTLGTLERIVETAYDHRNFVIQINTGGSITDMVRNAVGNLTSRTDPNLNPATSNTYDTLDRLNQYIDSIGGSTRYAYDSQDQLVQVQSPNGATTTYVYDDLGNILSELSPDRGLVAYTHDEAGNSITRTDARGIVANYTYDALNRLTGITYPTFGETVAFIYDTCEQGVGRVCAVSDETGTTALTYDGFDNVLSQARTQDGTVFTTRYAWDRGDRIVSMTYPDGRIVNWQRDAVGRIAAVDSTLELTRQNVISGRSYRSDGQMTAQSFGSGLTETREYDLQGRLITHHIGSHETRAYHYDANSNLLSIDKLTNPVNYQYDALDRLNAENRHSDLAGVTTQMLTAWSYDGNGNRMTRTSGTERAETLDCDPDIDLDCDAICTAGDWCFEEGERTRNYYYMPLSNRLTRVGNKTVVLDAGGNTVSDKNGKRAFEYNDAGRLVRFYRHGVLKAEYTYNAFNQRTKKIIHKEPDDQGNPVSHTLLFFYDPWGNLISEYKNGKPLRDYIWADAMLVQRDVLKRNSNGQTIIKNTLNVINDHLNTPRLAIDESNTIVWRWDSNGFGKGGIDKDPDGNGQKHNLRIRFPGQYADAESGLMYNWNRYYDSSTGRYITSDSIGLNGGINTYGYALQNPLYWYDSIGTDTISIQFNLRLPQWLTPGDGQGGGGGAAFSFPGFSGGEWDLGLSGTLFGGGKDYGTGRYSLDLNLTKGSVRDLSGKGAEISATIGGRGGDIILDGDDNISGIGFQLWGGGNNVGGAGTVSGTISIQDLLDGDNDECN